MDTITSILHALDDDAGITLEQARDDSAVRWERYEFLERAWRCYDGDFEDIEDEEGRD